MRTQFDIQLEALKTEMTTIGMLCENAIAKTSHALLTGDTALAGEMTELLNQVVQKERDIETICLKLLLRQQPVAKDLRIVSVALKMIRDMERIGDQAADIAEISRHIEDGNVFGRSHVQEMAQATIKMVTDSISSFVRRDVEAARKVVADDDKVDGLFLEVRRDLVAALAENTVVGESCIDILMIAKYLERIGDHATNIAEWVEYSVTGVHVRKGAD